MKESLDENHLAEDLRQQLGHLGGVHPHFLQPWQVVDLAAIHHLHDKHTLGGDILWGQERTDTHGKEREINISTQRRGERV